MIANIRAALRSYLLADSGIAAVVTARVFPLKMPQGETRASIVFTRVSGLSGVTSSGAERVARPRIQIDCWASDPDAAASLADLVKERIEGFTGTVQWDENSPGNAVKIQGVFMDMEREDFDDVAKLYRVSRDYMVWFEE
jgi:hypothetical protein